MEVTKQTAVKYLVSKLPLGVKGAILDKINEALEIEEQQIIDAWVQGYTEGYNDTHTIAEDYYNDTYGKA